MIQDDPLPIICPELSDYEIICEGHRFRVHKFMLVMKSRVLETEILDNLKETSLDVTGRSFHTLDSVRLLIWMWYSQTIHTDIDRLTQPEIRQLISLLDFYDSSQPYVQLLVGVIRFPVRTFRADAIWVGKFKYPELVDRLVKVWHNCSEQLLSQEDDFVELCSVIPTNILAEMLSPGHKTRAQSLKVTGNFEVKTEKFTVGAAQGVLSASSHKLSVGAAPVNTRCRQSEVKTAAPDHGHQFKPGQLLLTFDPPRVVRVVAVNSPTELATAARDDTAAVPAYWRLDISTQRFAVLPETYGVDHKGLVKGLGANVDSKLDH